MAAGVLDQCPICRARLDGAGPCRRCRAELDAIRRIADESAALAGAGLHRLAAGDRAAALRLIRRASVNTEAMTSAVRQAARTALATSLHNVFGIATALLVFATILTLFLREIPLRKSNRREVELKDEALCEA